MEEQLLFTRIHDALDTATPPGAYERLRSELTKKPVRPLPWPALQLRFSKVGFRLAAGLAIVAIVVAAAAAVLAIHNSTNNTSPAAPRMSIAAYQKMVADDNTAATATFSDPCGTGSYTGCVADAARGMPAIQKWIDDISRPNIPERFVVINAEMKQHLLQTITAMHDIVGASQNNDLPGMDRAYWVGSYALDWMSIVLPSIAASHQVDASAWIRFVASEVRKMDTCGAACGWAGNGNSCTATNDPITCRDLFDGGIGPTFAGFAGDLVKEAAPPSLANPGCPAAERPGASRRDTHDDPCGDRRQRPDRLQPGDHPTASDQDSNRPGREQDHGLGEKMGPANCRLRAPSPCPRSTVRACRAIHSVRRSPTT